MKALITGASGFIGSHLTEDLSKQGFEVIALRNSSPLSKQPSKQVLEQVCDIRQQVDVHSTLERHNPDLIIHAAALASTSRCEDSPQLCTQVNIDGTAHIANYYKNYSKKPIMIYLSSDLVFEGKEAPPTGFTENCQPLPLSIYSKSKLQGEEVWKTLGAGSFIFRVCLCYGPRKSSSPNVMDWICDSFEGNEKLNLFYDEWRTPVYVKDISRASHAVFTKFDKLKHEQTQILNLAGPQRLSRVEFGKKIAKAFAYDENLIVEKSRLEYESKTPRAKDVSLNCQKLKSELKLETSQFEDVFFPG